MNDTRPARTEAPRPERRKVGRPARVDRSMIARAAHEIGLGKVTMKGVAEHLGVSVPGLYHHVEGRDDLMRLAAEYSAAQLQLPVDRDQHWTEWLLEWGLYSHDAFVAQPELLSQFLRGSIGVERVVAVYDQVLGLLERRGFTPIEAFEAHTLVSETAMGAAVGHIRELEAADAGRPVLAEWHRSLAQHGRDELVHLRRLVAQLPAYRDSLADLLCTVLVGIAVRRGEPWKSIPKLARSYHR